MDPSAPAPSSSRQIATAEQKQAAIEEILNGETITNAAHIHGFSRATVARWYKAFRMEESGGDAPEYRRSANAAKQGNPPGKKSSTPEQDKALVKFVKNSPGAPIKYAIEATNFPGGVQTAMKRLKAAKVKYVGPKEMQKRDRKMMAKYMIMKLGGMI